MKDFLFAPEQARTPLRVLSGGERGRLMLARALAKPSNLLVLDEPTNDLDLETLDVLEEMLARLCRHRHPHQPRPRFPRPRRARRDRAGGRRPLDRIRRRLHRHAGAARRRSQRRKRTARPKAAPKAQTPPPAEPQPNAAKRRLSFKDKHALETLPSGSRRCRTRRSKLQRALDDPGLYARDRQGVRRHVGAPWPRRRASSRPRKSSGSSSKSCARKSRAASQHFCARASHASAPRAASAPVAKQACRR